jgi:hypothetical protein
MAWKKRHLHTSRRKNKKQKTIPSHCLAVVTSQVDRKTTSFTRFQTNRQRCFSLAGIPSCHQMTSVHLNNPKTFPVSSVKIGSQSRTLKDVRPQLSQRMESVNLCHKKTRLCKVLQINWSQILPISKATSSISKKPETSHDSESDDFEVTLSQLLNVSDY